MSRILMVEDDPFVRELVQVVLTKAGHEVLEAASVASGNYVLDREPIDLLITDLGLPDGDGEALIRRAQAAGVDKVVVVSGRAAPTTVHVDASMRKPVRIDELVQVVEELVGKGALRAPAVAAVPPVSAEPGRVVLVDRMAALAGVTEALARSASGELPLRSTLRRYLDAPGVDLVAVYRSGPAGLPELVVSALTHSVPVGDISSFFGRGDLLAAADVVDDVLVDLCIDEGPVGEVLSQAGMGRIVVSPLVFAGKVLGVVAIGFGGRDEEAPTVFIRTLKSQLVLLMALAEADADTEVQLLDGGETHVERFRL